MCIKVENGKVLNSNKNIVESPYMLCDGDVFLKWGTRKQIVEYFAMMSKTLGRDLVKEVKVVDLSKLEGEDIRYILERAINFTHSGFVREVSERILGNGFKSWLEMEKSRV